MLEVPASLVAGDKRPPDFELVRTSNSVRKTLIINLVNKQKVHQFSNKGLLD